MSELETPEQRDRRRRSEPTGERIARLEERCDALDGDLREVRRQHALLEGRLWLLVAGAATAGSAAGAGVASLFGG